MVLESDQEWLINSILPSNNRPRLCRLSQKFNQLFPGKSMLRPVVVGAKLSMAQSDWLTIFGPKQVRFVHEGLVDLD